MFGEILQIAQLVVTVVAGIVLWSYRAAYQSGRWTASTTARVDQIEQRMDRASHLLSELTGTVQAIFDRMRREYVPRELGEQWYRESVTDRARIWECLDRLQDQKGSRRP